MILSDICQYVSEKISVSSLDENTYISTENMLPNKSGITVAHKISERFCRGNGYSCKLLRFRILFKTTISEQEGPIIPIFAIRKTEDRKSVV